MLVPKSIRQIPIPTGILSGLHTRVYSGIDLHSMGSSQVRFHPQDFQSEKRYRAKRVRHLHTEYGGASLGLAPRHILCFKGPERLQEQGCMISWLTNPLTVPSFPSHVLPRRIHILIIPVGKEKLKPDVCARVSFLPHVSNISHYDNYLLSKCQASSFVLVNIDTEKIIGQNTPLTYVCIPP